MELPDLGQHCQVRTCNRLDFLPMKCDACSMVFCCDHYTYAKHSCQIGLQRDVQVPVCPLCNKPVPSKRGQQPDIAVSDHLDRDCQSDPAIAKRKVYTNKCSVKGCKKKEVIKITCATCKKMYCLIHRHPSDHKCEEQKAMSPSEAAGVAAVARAQNTKNPTLFSWFNRPSCSSSVDRKPAATSLPEVSVDNYQIAMTEDEALALALQNSLNEEAGLHSEEDDRRYAMLLARTEREQHNQQGRQRRGREEEKDKCCLS